MDPLSITASVIAIATAAAQISKAIRGLRAFGEVPGRIYAVKNEVADLEVVLRQVGHALQQPQRRLSPDADYGELTAILARTQDRLSELAETLGRVATSCESAAGSKISRASIWWKEKSRFQRLQNDIHSIKESLNLMLGASNSSVSIYICPARFQSLTGHHPPVAISTTSCSSCTRSPC